MGPKGGTFGVSCQWIHLVISIVTTYWEFSPPRPASLRTLRLRVDHTSGRYNYIPGSRLLDAYCYYILISDVVSVRGDGLTPGMRYWQNNITRLIGPENVVPPMHIRRRRISAVARGRVNPSHKDTEMMILTLQAHLIQWTIGVIQWTIGVILTLQAHLIKHPSIEGCPFLWVAVVRGHGGLPREQGGVKGQVLSKVGHPSPHPGGSVRVHSSGQGLWIIKPEVFFNGGREGLGIVKPAFSFAKEYTLCKRGPVYHQTQVKWNTKWSQRGLGCHQTCRM
jgi:hypothetical protein